MKSDLLLMMIDCVNNVLVPLAFDICSVSYPVFEAPLISRMHLILVNSSYNINSCEIIIQTFLD